MRIVGHGVDIVKVAKVQLLLDHAEEETITDWFTGSERVQAPTAEGPRAEHFAGQVAAKEAIVKALGTGLIGDMAWTEIEVLRRESGAPNVTLYGAVQEAANQRRIATWYVSISHGDEYAVASAIAVSH